jgi:hypothetical protein
MTVARNKPWSTEDLARLQALAAQGDGKREIALALGRTQQAVEAKLWRLRGQPIDRPSNGKARKRRSGGASFFLS